MGFFHKMMLRSRVNRAVLAEHLGDYLGALELYKDAMKGCDAPTQADLLNSIGMLHYAMNDMAAARASYEQSLALDPSASNVMMNLANALDQLGEDAAEAAYGRARTAKNDSPEVLYNYAAFVAKREPLRAVELLHKCLDALGARTADGTVAIQLPLALLVKLSASHGLVDQTDKYLDELEANALAEDRLLIMNEHALLLITADRHEVALVLYRTILKEQPDLAEIRFNLGMALARQKRLDEALVEFEALNAPEASYGIGFVQELRGDTALALREYRAYLEAAQPKKPNALAAPGIDFATPLIERARAFIESYGTK